MSLAIRFGDPTDSTSVSGAIYFNAVTDFSKSFSGRVTEHPIEAGASVTDHYISKNPLVRISGVVSSVDFSYIPEYVILDGEPVINNEPIPSAVRVGGLGGLKQYLPGVVSQFLPTLSPQVVVDNQNRKNHKSDIELKMKELMNGLYFDPKRNMWVNRMTPTTLYEVDWYSTMAVMDNLIVTKFQVKETVDTGDSLEFDMELEQVRFVTLEEAEAPKPQKNTPTERSTKPTENKGNQSSTPEPATPRPAFSTDRRR